MQPFNPDRLKDLYIPPADSHKGQNGKVMVIGGSRLFHAASLWALEVASKIVDMVYYASVTENNDIVQQAKEQFRNGIVIPRTKIEAYMQEADSILIGPGLPRLDGQEPGDDDTQKLTEKLLSAYPHKKWVIDGGSLQMMNPELIPPHAILTPHAREFETLISHSALAPQPITDSTPTGFATHYNCIVVLKGATDIIASTDETVAISGGNAGMTKGGTGDVLAGLIAALYAKNPAFLSASGGSYINKRASEKLATEAGYWYNATDLAREIPHILKEVIPQGTS
jgi:hydroxyethylthiazole kinase-like uncharacterized protein yjeF